jgi:nicotinamidase-related amidase
VNALLVIDVQCGMFANPASPPHEGEAIVARTAGLIERARAAGTPVIYVQHDGGPSNPLALGKPGFPFRPELAPRPEDPVVVKHHCSAFQDTELAEILALRGIDHLTICGMQTEFCVDTSCRAAYERGFKVTLVSDAHTTFDGPVLPAEAIIRHHNALLGDGFVRLRDAEGIQFGA